MRTLLLLGDFGVPSLTALLASRHRPTCVVLATQTSAPPRATPVDRIRSHLRPLLWPGAMPPPPRDFRPWKVAASLARDQVPFLTEREFTTHDFFDLIRRHAVELLLSIGYPRLLPATLLKMTLHGGVNIHPSLLPHYRGPSPVFWQIALGETESGVTMHRMTTQADAGPILWQEKTPIGQEETAGRLFYRLANLAASFLPKALDRLEAGALPEWQRESGVGSKQHRFRDEDSVVDWSRSAEELTCLVRACNPFPGARTRLADGECVRIWMAHAWNTSTSATPGEIAARRCRSFDVNTGYGLLRVKTATSDRGHRFPTWGRPWTTLASGAILGQGEVTKTRQDG